MSIFVSEFIGTGLMILLGNGVVATCVLKGTKCGDGGHWLIITTAWAFAVFVGVVVAGESSGAHLNPAVTLALALAHKLEWQLVPSYIAGEFLGAMFGALLVWIMYKQHFALTSDEGAKRACFCTSPAIRNYPSNFLSEAIGTFVLIFVILHLSGANIILGTDSTARIGLGSLGALPVAILVWVIGLSLGATTGYAINPARDLGPRIVLFLLPLKISADWGYAWIPICAPIVGGVVAVYLSNIL
ncbi:glycerol uptake facilitator protein [Helicobacter mustelae]|uniref:MIP/aquaporin family protein n=1 Tax=Helicobacter mustelae TaxID=217 RepID=UPI000E025447|nr:MIP/aquaporin family protein [Helicobacter mustelae]STP12386.1 glycerol uptake facilitator protein [Helicobacter mustelae]